MKFFWDKQKQIYLDEQGRVLTPTEFFKLLETLIEKVEVRVRDHVRAWVAEPGTGGLVQRAISSELSKAHRMMGTIAWGGLEQINFDARRQVDSKVRVQFSFLLRFGSELPRLSPEAAEARIAQYAGATYATYDAAARASHTRAGYTHARWVLDRGAEHCAACPEQARRGVQPVGNFPPLGSLTCLSNCRCVLRYEKPETSESEVAA